VSASSPGLPLCNHKWTPSPFSYPTLAQLWWQNISQAVTGEMTPQAAMDKLAKEMDDVMARLERAGMKNCAPKLNPEVAADEWLAREGSPKPKLANEKPRGETVPYEQLIQSWQQ
jgi:glycerol transport system substrate-binding protein